ncbi:MAG: nitrate/nitrite transporter NrtS [Myxococcota bacterium]
MNASPENPPRPGWLAVAREPAIVGRALRVAAVVGTLLVAINYTDRFLAGSLGSLDWMKMGLTYLVPYGVSTYTAVMMRRRAQ